MNTRIQELVDQTAQLMPGVYNIVYEDDKTGVEFTESALKKFAELIVRECVKHITDQQDLVETNWQCKDGIHIVYSLKEHFGVKE